jgi:hypothetical protein
MKTARKWLAGLPAALLLAMLFVSCEVTGAYKTIDSKLHGTWESTDTNLYSGKLLIGSDTVTITGYAESQTPPVWNGGDDARRPFGDFAKNAPYACYTEDEKLFIMTVLDEKIVPYRYSTNSQGRFLFFNFGGREEALKRTGD